MIIMTVALMAQAAEPFIRFDEENAVGLDRSVQVRGKLLVDAPVAGQWSATAFAMLSPGYGELYLGPTLNFKSVSFNLAVGLETADEPWRVSGSAWSNLGRFHALGLVEYGGSGFWCKLRSTFDITDWLALGAFGQRFDGLGPLVALHTHDLELWVSPVYDPEDTTGAFLLGVSWTP